MNNPQHGSSASQRVPEVIPAPTRRSLRASQSSQEPSVPYTRKQMRERASALQQSRQARHGSAVAGSSVDERNADSSAAQLRRGSHSASASGSTPASSAANAHAGDDRMAAPRTRREYLALQRSGTSKPPADSSADSAASAVPAVAMTRRERREQLRAAQSSSMASGSTQSNSGGTQTAQDRPIDKAPQPAAKNPSDFFNSTSAEPQTRRARREAGLTGQIPVVQPSQHVVAPPMTGAIRRVAPQGTVGPVEEVPATGVRAPVPVSTPSPNPATISQSARDVVEGTPADAAPVDVPTAGAPTSAAQDNVAIAEQWSRLAQDFGLNNTQVRKPVQAPRPGQPHDQMVRPVSSTAALPISDEPEKFDPAQIVEQTLRNVRQASAAPASQARPASEVTEVPAESSAVEVGSATAIPEVQAAPQVAEADPVPAQEQARKPLVESNDPVKQATRPDSETPYEQPGVQQQFAPASGSDAVAPTVVTPISGSIAAVDNADVLRSTLATGSIPVVRSDTASQPIVIVNDPLLVDDLDPDLEEDHKGLQRLHWGIILAIALVLGLVIWKGDFDSVGAGQTPGLVPISVAELSADGHSPVV